MQCELILKNHAQAVGMSSLLLLPFFLVCFLFSSVAGMACNAERGGPDRHCSDRNGQNFGLSAAWIHPHGRTANVTKWQRDCAKNKIKSINGNSLMVNMITKKKKIKIAVS